MSAGRDLSFDELYEKIKNAQDFYEVLSLKQTSKESEIKAAYRKYQLMFHPDKAKDKTKGEEIAKILNEAYAALSNSEKRQIYDTMLSDRKDEEKLSKQPSFFHPKKKTLEEMTVEQRDREDPDPIHSSQVVFYYIDTSKLRIFPEKQTAKIQINLLLPTLKFAENPMMAIQMGVKKFSDFQSAIDYSCERTVGVRPYGLILKCNGPAKLENFLWLLKFGGEFLLNKVEPALEVVALKDNKVMNLLPWIVKLRPLDAKLDPNAKRQLLHTCVKFNNNSINKIGEVQDRIEEIEKKSKDPGLTDMIRVLKSQLEKVRAANENKPASRFRSGR